jgi:environmental stress-induced protein Ves
VTTIRHAGLVISPWRNGAGRKADIAIGPGWLIGFAFLDADAPFSDYSGHDRTITLIDGPGFTLAGPGHPPLAVTQPATPTAFDGGWPVDCHILDAPCVVLNVMTARPAWRHQVDILHGAIPPLADPGAVAEVLVILAGELRLAGETLRRRDALRLDGNATPQASDDALIWRAAVWRA